MPNTHPTPVKLEALDRPNQPPVTPELIDLYKGFEEEMMVPLWYDIGNLMPFHPETKAAAHVWRWENVIKLAEKSGEIVPVSRGGERRAIALANPLLDGRPYATPTLWAAVQYLCPEEIAPYHRHTQNAFRFVVEGEGVWTLVNSDPVPMRRGDFLPQGGWAWHAHQNPSLHSMAWIDGLDIPFQHEIESGFFEYGPDELDTLETPDVSRSEMLWGRPGLAPLRSLGPTPKSPLLAYRWENTDAALRDQLILEKAGHAVTVEPGHAAVRFTNPNNGLDTLPTIRTEMHRIAAGAETAPVKETGSSVYQVFDGTGTITIGEETWNVSRGDLFVVPSWKAFSVKADAGQEGSDSGAFDLFRFSDSPMFEKLDLHRIEVVK
ncbi:MAG TPA: cupin domain-containing protein [Actinomycetaceae bacterium]|nr:cupin domain-containing protein [Actinomycetaceae bacterium]